ncbi:MAG: hypothetical protein KDK07_20785 [Bauldia sp.]|nr:hypothetical protein [Bauldia sp.]
MRSSTIGLAAVLVLAGIGTGIASTAPDADGAATSAYAPESLVSQTPSDDGSIVVARRGRGSDDNGGNHHSGTHGDKHKGGHDDGPGHDRNDDHGKHDRKHT